MVAIDLTGKHALVTGVADDVGFGWHIAKALKAAGAKVYLASHPRTVAMVERILKRATSLEGRLLPYGTPGEFLPDAIWPCDVEFDTEEDILPERRLVKGYDGDVSIAGCMKRVKETAGGLDIVIHSVAFSPEIQNGHLDTSRKAYLQAMSISSYSLVALVRAAMPLMEGRHGAVVGLSYLGGERVMPFYGGGMAAAKAALQQDARVAAFFAGQQGHRVNIVSAGPYASRAASSIGAIDAAVQHVAEHSPLKQPITAQDVADTTLFLCSPLSRAITGEVIHVDMGYHAMAV
ncbi:MAG: SDR family oxidoreductase [Deltaproteobacteria bacterium]|nr:SDR family oxidoreductase [Deltaproteobacteria bacterium]